MKGGAAISATGLWRTSPWFAWGGALVLAGFANEPQRSTMQTDAKAAAAFLFLIGRVYVLDEGRFDPYAELGLGGGALGTSYRLGSEKYEETGAGPALRLGVGFDILLTRSIRLGPHLTYSRAFVDKIRRCVAGGGGECADAEKTSDGYLAGMLTLGGTITFMIGEEL